MRTRWNPPRGYFDGSAFGAASFAPAGRIETARGMTRALPAGDRWRTAGAFLNVGRSVADTGDDRAAGAIMERGVAFWPNPSAARGLAMLGPTDR